MKATRHRKHSYSVSISPMNSGDYNILSFELKTYTHI